MNKPAPSELHQHVGYWLRCLSNMVSHTFADRLAKHDVSVPQWVVLRTLYDKTGLTLNEAAEQVGVDKSTLSRGVERMLQKGWITRCEGRDRRSVDLALTPAGKALVRQAAKLADENDAVFFGSLAHREREEFLATIKQLLVANGWNVATRGHDQLE